MKISNTKIENIKTDIDQAIKSGSFQSSNLILLVLNPTEIDEVIVKNVDSQFKNLSKLLSEKLVVLSLKDREQYLHSLVSDLVKEAVDICYFSRINLLFEESLQADPLKLLQHAAKKKPIIVIWPGSLDSMSLSYAKPGLPDYKSYKLNEFQDVQVITTCEQGVK
ncbi:MULTISPECIES: BREX-3 system P-loop-containing protein BrxF [unclassified Pseudoalteromonas]|uniref:BREX-3 system P-loop-containing protein BrxF n=1 Tax=unclassified Pseudoalteromonas TaxID=194690 RepID=UPI0025B4004D|nr:MULTISPECIES: BREX-3 system P-loop-containing protein BrxF [unclassified Pseudoalteromonas]MDN3395741.1 BREX-3 system P-loop-containing protein BrxF [Pseudoalteromonas sp. APC 3215]MDN3471840.1 BREX-3 system P-loop-containing protein BrxF [Pseudoalteromonas sp. APC 4026]|tara:strand:+ start:114 stop:608 length:495 start_codon:yes stop_codon:yes gene_type:complete